MRKTALFVEYSSRKVQILSYVPENFSSKTTLDQFLTVLTTCQNVCRRTKKSTLKVRKKQQKNLFKTIRFSQETLWTHSKQFWLPCQKVFPRGLKFIVNYCFFPPNISSFQKCNPGHVKCSFTDLAEKLSRMSAVFSWLHFKT